MYLDKGRVVSLPGDDCSPGISWQCWTLYFIWGPKRCQCKWGKPSLGWKAIINLSQRAKTSTEATTWYVLKNKEIPCCCWGNFLSSATPKIPERPQKSNKVGWWQNYKQLKNTLREAGESLSGSTIKRCLHTDGLWQSANHWLHWRTGRPD